MKANQIFTIKTFPQGKIAVTPKKTTLNFSNLVLACGAFSVFLSSSIVLGSSMISSFGSFYTDQNSLFEYEKQNIHRTSIPWLENRKDCEHTGRTWEGGKCWDSEHDMMF